MNSVTVAKWATTCSIKCLKKDMEKEDMFVKAMDNNLPLPNNSTCITWQNVDNAVGFSYVKSYIWYKLLRGG